MCLEIVKYYVTKKVGQGIEGHKCSKCGGFFGDLFYGRYAVGSEWIESGGVITSFAGLINLLPEKLLSGAFIDPP